MLAGALGDQHAALLGQACLAPGDAKKHLWHRLFPADEHGETPHFSTRGLITTLAFRLGNAPAHYALEGSIAIAGALVQWLRDNLGSFPPAARDRGAGPFGSRHGRGLCRPAFSGLFAPWWRPDARGIICGLTRFSTKAHIARAALEAAAYQTRDALAAMEADAGAPIATLKVDGGMAANDLLMQFQADILGVRCRGRKSLETTALGAAYAAGLACGVWASPQDIAARWREDRRFTPAMAAAERERRVAGWTRAVERSFDLA